MAAIAAYVRQLRDTQGISREKLAEMVGTSGNNIWRIEEQGQEPRGGLLLLIVQALHGSLQDASVLLKEKVPEEEGRRLAVERLAASSNTYADQQVAAFRERVGTEQADAIARRLVSDPGFVDAIRRAAQQLLDE